MTLLSLLTLTKHDCLFFFYSAEVRVTATDLVKLQNSRHTEKYILKCIYEFFGKQMPAEDIRNEYFL